VEGFPFIAKKFISAINTVAYKWVEKMEYTCMGYAWCDHIIFDTIDFFVTTAYTF
jgi:hypothetical protein